MNNKGQTLALSIISAVMIFIVGAMLIQFIMPEVTTARTSSVLDCTNSGITDGQKLTCLIVDITVPYGIILFVSIAGGLITAKFLV